jgi:N-acyl-D-amino-acid deacylase
MRKLFLVFLPAFLFFSKQKTGYDTIIRHAMICDGSGHEPFSADIGIIADTIAFIGDLERGSAKSEIDAKGLTLVPGFIDTHSHHAGELFQHRDFLAAVSQGITTIIIGQDGESNFPLATFFQQVSDTPVAINIDLLLWSQYASGFRIGKRFQAFRNAG